MNQKFIFMKKTRRSYKKPFIKEKKIAISFFLTKMDLLDHLPFGMDVYAQGGGGSSAAGEYSSGGTY